MNKEASDAIKNKISLQIADYVERHMEKPNISTKWGKPLVGFADAASPYILALKEVVGPGHQTPADVLEDASIVIAYYVPFTTKLAKTNAEYGRLASLEWALAYEETNAMFVHLNAHLIEFLESMGYRAAVSKEATKFPLETLKSNWSHRHLAYAAGLGTFGLNNMLITKSGCCGRYSTVATNLDVIPDSPLTEELCLYKKDGSCKVCIDNCPVTALSTSEYDRWQCYSLLRENAEIYTEFSSSYQDDTEESTAIKGSQVCGKCITASPCAFWQQPSSRSAIPALQK
jgi:epoxyqueuosine reductase QueG